MNNKLTQAQMEKLDALISGMSDEAKVVTLTLLDAASNIPVQYITKESITNGIKAFTELCTMAAEDADRAMNN